LINQKNVGFLLIVFAAIRCFHGPERISHWSDLDAIANLKCDAISFFEEEESIKVRSVDILDQGGFFSIKVKHLDRRGKIETRIGRMERGSHKPIWTWKAPEEVPVYFSPDDYLTSESSNLFHHVKGEKVLLRENPENDSLIVAQIDDKTLALSWHDQIEIMSRENLGTPFKTRQNFRQIDNFSQYKLGVKWYVQKDRIWWVQGWDRQGLWQMRIGPKKMKAIRLGPSLHLYEVLGENSSSSVSLIANDLEKSWKNQYLRIHEVPGQLIIQRWVDSESVVELVDPVQLKISVLGVLPENWWVRGSLNSRNTHFLVEGDGKWQTCIPE